MSNATARNVRGNEGNSCPHTAATRRNGDDLNKKIIISSVSSMNPQGSGIHCSTINWIKGLAGYHQPCLIQDANRSAARSSLCLKALYRVGRRKICENNPRDVNIHSPGEALMVPNYPLAGYHGQHQSCQHCGHHNGTYIQEKGEKG